MKFHITELALNDVVLEAEQKKVIVFDTEVSGFVAQITNKGSKAYAVIYRDANGVQRQEKLATVGEMSAQTARNLAKLRLKEIASDRPKALAVRRPWCPTMDSFFYKTYLEVIKKQNRSHETHASIYRNHVQGVFGPRRLNEITEGDISDLNDMLRRKLVAGGRWKTQATKTLSDGTVKRILILVRHMFNVAIVKEVGGIQRNPTHELKLTAAREVKGRFLTKMQIERLMKAADELGERDMLEILQVVAATGLRRNNVLAMRWDWFDPDRGTLTVPAAADKAGKGFTLFLAEGVVNLLVARQRTAAPGPWVFPNPKTEKPYHSRYSAWSSVRRRAGLDGLRIHDLRHTYASMMLDSGSDILDVQKALGHTQLSTTAVYLHLRDGRKREKANAAVQAAGIF